MEKRWIFNVRKLQMLRVVLAGEGGTVNKLAKSCKVSVAYAHDLLAELVKDGKVAKVETRSNRYGTVYHYYSKFHYVAVLASLNILDLSESSEEYAMIEAFMNEAKTAYEWYFGDIEDPEVGLVQEGLF